MTEEIIINEKSLQAVLKRCDELEQENKELKELKCKFKEYCTCDTERYRSALEEIRENLVKLKTNDEDDFTYEYSKIEDKINEVLK